MNDPKAPPAARVGAATAVLDRGWGRPTQSIEGQVGLTFERNDPDGDRARRAADLACVAYR